MATLPTSLVVLVGLVGVLGGCVTEAAGSSVEASCADVAALVEAFPPGAGGPSGRGALAGPLGELAEGMDDPDVRAAAGRLAEIESVTATEPASAATESAAVDGAPDGPGVPTFEEEDWYVDLDVVDAWAVDHCGFSPRIAVLEAVPDGGPGASVVAAPAEGLDDVLDWVDVLERVRALPPDDDWTNRGYEAAVGIDPGISVVVRGVPDLETALVVCDDVVTVLAAEAGPEQLRVQVTTRSGLPLAETEHDGSCSEQA